jgi:hypothetical protein
MFLFSLLLQPAHGHLTAFSALHWLKSKLTLFVGEFRLEDCRDMCQFFG